MPPYGPARHARFGQSLASFAPQLMTRGTPNAGGWSPMGMIHHGTPGLGAGGPSPFTGPPQLMPSGTPNYGGWGPPQDFQLQPMPRTLPLGGGGPNPYGGWPQNGPPLVFNGPPGMGENTGVFGPLQMDLRGTPNFGGPQQMVRSGPRTLADFAG